MTEEVRRWLDAAARIAMPFRGTTADNPTVGAMIVAPDGRLVGRGVTAPGGRPHAETIAIAMAGDAARGATLFVTLEPCAHRGQTPPCVGAVIAAGIARVVVGMSDPDPRTGGSSLSRMREAGIAVELADHAPSRHLHQGHVCRIVSKRPYVTVKLAVSRDGMIGRRDAGNVAITGETARRWTHMQRALSDAVMVGAGTARLDAPRLSVRLAGLEDRTPLRVVLEGRHTLTAPLIRAMNASGQPTLILGVSTPAPDDDGARLAVQPDAAGRPDLNAALHALAARGVGRAWVEGGATLSDALLEAGLVDRFQMLQAKLEIGADGVPASVHGPLPQRLAKLGFALVAERSLGCDRLATFERH